MEISSYVSNNISSIKDEIIDYLSEGTAYNTRRAYKSHIKCYVRNGYYLPATIDEVLRYLNDKAKVLNCRTLQKHLVSLRAWHVYQNLSDPTRDDKIKKTMKGIERIHGKKTKKAKPLTYKQLKRICDFYKKNDNLYNLRTRALLITGFFGMFRRSELVSILVSDICFQMDGVTITIPRSKTDQNHEGKTAYLSKTDDEICPYKILKELILKMELMGNTPLFRSVTKSHKIKKTSINSDIINYLIKAAIEDIGDDNSEDYSSHSLRRGFATECANKGIESEAIMFHGRWQSLNNMMGYIDEADGFKNNLISKFYSKL